MVSHALQLSCMALAWVNARSICAGFEKPSTCQQKGVVPIRRAWDVVLQAPYGTGRISTFCMGILNNLNYSVMQCQAVVLAPIRERAQQIERVIRSFGSYVKVKCHACVGGTLVREDMRILGEGVHVVVGTPDCVFDMIRCGSLQLAHIRMFFVGQADELLSGGFKNKIFETIRLLPARLQVI
jgi:translation initiation factor 4A